jgi:hypothetical protein
MIWIKPDAIRGGYVAYVSVKSYVFTAGAFNSRQAARTWAKQTFNL